MRHLLDTTDLSVSEINDIIALADDIISDKKKYAKVCEGKKLATLFFEPSTRTRLSFEAAMLELGGSEALFLAVLDTEIFFFSLVLPCACFGQRTHR